MSDRVLKVLTTGQMTGLAVLALSTDFDMRCRMIFDRMGAHVMCHDGGDVEISDLSDGQAWPSKAKMAAGSSCSCATAWWIARWRTIRSSTLSSPPFDRPSCSIHTSSFNNLQDAVELSCSLHPDRQHRHGRKGKKAQAGRLAGPRS